MSGAKRRVCKRVVTYLRGRDVEKESQAEEIGGEGEEERERHKAKGVFDNAMAWW